MRQKSGPAKPPAGPKYRAALSVAYGAGLRASEVTALKIGDIPRVKPGGRLAPG